MRKEGYRGIPASSILCGASQDAWQPRAHTQTQKDIPQVIFPSSKSTPRISQEIWLRRMFLRVDGGPWQDTPGRSKASEGNEPSCQQLEASGVKLVLWGGERRSWAPKIASLVWLSTWELCCLTESHQLQVAVEHLECTAYRRSSVGRKPAQRIAALASISSASSPGALVHRPGIPEIQREQKFNVTPRIIQFLANLGYLKILF